MRATDMNVPDAIIQLTTKPCLMIISMETSNTGNVPGVIFTWLMELEKERGII